MNFVHIFFIGVIILVGAIVINLIVGYFGISTWFVFSESIKQIGFVSAIKKESFVSLLFLFIIYPLFLGLLGWVGRELFN